jgi:hypothetical protein
MHRPAKRHCKRQDCQRAYLSPTQSPLSKLPDDVLGLVLRAAFGEDAKGRVPFMRTSKRTYQNPKMWGRKVSFRADDRPPPDWLRKRRSVTSIAFKPGEKWFAHLQPRDLALLQGTAVTKLVIKRVVVDLFGGAQFWRLLTGLPITHLSMIQRYRSDVGLGGALEALPHLRHLEWGEASGLHHVQGPRLTHLGLWGAKTPPLLSGVNARSFGSLTSLDLTNCALLNSLDNLRGMQLTTLNISHCSGLKRGNIEALASLPLVRLVYRACRNMAHLETVALLGATLLHLDLSYSRIEDEDLAALRGLRRLKTLSLSSCDLRKLGTLFLLSCDLMAPGLRHLVDMSPSLELLDLRYTGIKMRQCPQELWHCIRV